MSSVLILDFAVPPKALRPNAGQVHPRLRARLAQEQKKSAYYQALEAMGGRPNDGSYWAEKVSIELTQWYGFKPLDPDNLQASFKHAIDGLVAARVVFDDGPKYVTILPPQFECDRSAAPCVQMVVRRVP